MKKVAVDALDCYQKELLKAAEYLEVKLIYQRMMMDEWNAKLDIIQKHRVPAVELYIWVPGSRDCSKY